MYFVFIAVFIGAIIGAFTNALAIKMLFRPFKPWKIGSFTLPFTPGLIPKRRDEIAEKLGDMVENYLFTPAGMKDFVDKSGIKEKLFQKIIEKINTKRSKNITFGELVSKYISHDFMEDIESQGKVILGNYISDNRLRERTIESLLSEETEERIEEKLPELSDFVLQEIKRFIHSIEGRRFIESSITGIFEGKKMIGFIANFIGDQFEEMVIHYLDQILAKETTKKQVDSLLLKGWYKLKEKTLAELMDGHEEIISREIDRLVESNVNKLEKLPLESIMSLINMDELIVKWYDTMIEYILKRLDRIFSYLSISQVVREEVNKFSLLELERLILDVSGKELKMITYLGGVLGGMIGLFQGFLYLFL